MVSSPRPWRSRALTVITVSTWSALAVGIVGTILEQDGSSVVLPAVAAGLGAVWGLVGSATPIGYLERPLVLDIVTLGGVVLTSTGVAITGGAASPFLLLSLTPALYAALLGGLRPGMSAAVLSVALLTAVTLAQGLSMGATLVVAALYLVLAATVAQIRRIVMELELRAEQAEASSQSTTVRLEQLEHANSLLADLAEITGGEDLNPIDIGRAGLEALARRYPEASAVAMVDGEAGPIVVARHGAPVTGGHMTSVPLEVGERKVGVVRLTTPTKLDSGEIDGLAASLRPLALAFANALLLQDIARSAVKQERTRLARELHDEIGPSLASLGLSLDVAMINSADQRELATHLEQLRERVGGLVDEVRSTVADLRSSSSESLSSYLDGLSSDDLEPKLIVDLDERRPARPSLATDIQRIVGEAVRNAIRHSNGQWIQVRGWVDFDRGRIVVQDNGTGFDPKAVPDGHFGVIGMHERASNHGIRLNISSSASGTAVQLEWGQQ